MRKILIILSALIFSFSVANAKIILKAGHAANPDEPYHKGMLELKRIVEKETNGEVEIQIFPNGQLGSEKEMIEVDYLISEILKSRNDDKKLNELETKVRDIAKEFQPYG